MLLYNVKLVDNHAMFTSLKNTITKNTKLQHVLLIKQNEIKTCSGPVYNDETNV